VATTIGKYEIVSELGRGAMGVVFLARDPDIGRHVAIKVIHAHAYIGKEEAATLRMRLVREARAAGNLSHPGIVTVYHLDQQDDFLYIVMEFVEGQSLDKHLADGNAKTPEESIRILRQIGEALDYAHKRGIFHRDIKPENVLIDEAGRAKITDFGIARIASQKVTQTGVTMGTPAYMSPEQIRDGAVDGRADQFSLAVVAFEMLTGRQPWEASSNQALILKIATQEPPFAHEVNAALPRGCSRVLAKALAKRLELRYSTCAEFVDAMAETLIPQSLPDMEDPPRRRRYLIPGIIGAAVLAIAVGLWMFVFKSHTRINAKDGLRYAWVPPGAFSMGCSAGDLLCQSDEKPAHLVTITKGFWIGQTEVPVAEYRRVTGKFAFSGQGEAMPVTPDSWSDAKGYCDAIGMRLPTEAEWEYAARGGHPTERYGTLDAIAWYDGNSGVGNNPFGQIQPQQFPPHPARLPQTWQHPVGQKQPNKYGLYDMLGNVMEWVGDWYDAGYYAASPSIDPQGPANGKYRVARGAYHGALATWVRVSARNGLDLNSFTGFRCASNVLPNP
jgi:formylglycine-generating enzyme required for sulfatase activity/tRNA A-37 threonylcarbamoyl transferase component Bud32